MSNPFQLTFTLKQHTPIIHFQHDQEGATLRATEVKPKLDRFILTKLGDGNYQAGVEAARRANYLVGKHNALDYKISFSTHGEQIKFLPLPLGLSSRNNPDREKNLVAYLLEQFDMEVTVLEPTLYFANSDKIKFRGQNVDENLSKFEDIKYALQQTEPIQGSVRTLNIGLAGLVRNALTEFFLCNNFGTRQNKGFGSFTVDPITGLPRNASPTLNSIFSFKSRARIQDISHIFKFIKDEYQLLKSGTSKPNYSKSNLFEYFVNNVTPPIRWEKRYIKQFITRRGNNIDGKNLFSSRFAAVDKDAITNNYYNEVADRQTNEYRFVRALLGLAEQYEFLIFDANGGVDFRDKYSVSVKHIPQQGSDGIERFKSPLFFKVIDGVIYLRADDSYRQLLDQNFEFTLKLKSNGRITRTMPPIPVPSSFDINDFLSNYLSDHWTNQL